jgi:hypothetical protein
MLLCFDLAPDLTGRGLSSQLLRLIEDAGVDKNNLVGQACDGTASMSGQHTGVQPMNVQRQFICTARHKH